MTRMPQITPHELLRFLRSQSFVDDRQSGSHLTLWHEDKKISVTVPVHTGCDLGHDTYMWRGIAVRILKDAGFSVDDYLRLK
ncbi:MAG TPA: type II toxin-antitoxin system HicA family toxin [Candidatus Bathyarchaeia archaeon]|nr:type II toxin-antitoxin system HicA family toxin [Candidatus Bathyarchaeia archaeon]